MESTLELLIKTAAAGDTQGADELLEVDCSILVLVKDIEYVVGKVSGVAEGEELLVYPTEFGFVEVASGAVLAETLVPVRDGDEERGRCWRGIVPDHCCSSFLSTDGCVQREANEKSRRRTVCVLLEVSELFGGEFALRLAHGCGGGRESDPSGNVDDRDRKAVHRTNQGISAIWSTSGDRWWCRWQRGQLSQ